MNVGIGGNERQGSVIVALQHPQQGAAALQLAVAVAQAWGRPLALAATVEVAREESLSEGTIRAQELRQQLGELVAALPGRAAVNNPAATEAANASVSGPGKPNIRTVVRVGRERWVELRELAVEERAALLVIALDNAIDPQAPLLLGSTLIEQALADAPCDMVLVRGAGTQDDGQTGDVLLAVRGGPYADLALDISEALCHTEPARKITTLHVVRQDLPVVQQVYEEMPYSRFRTRLEANGRVQRRQVASRNVEQAVLSEAARHNWTVLGVGASERSKSLPGNSPLSRALGPIPAAALINAPRNIALVKTRRPVAPEISQYRAATTSSFALDPETLSLIVDKWFAENTFHANEFRDLDRLVALKRSQGLTISLGLPALNEAATVGKVISVLKEALYERVPLLDEIVLIDSNSEDRTREIGRELGIPVYIHQQALPEAGAALHGKGEALWKSLHLLKGDIIVWVDTDITNMTPQFVYGLVGPLLAEPRIKYVKGYYRRPIKSGTILAEEGGGRVTELTARPLFNLFYPQLSGLIQPLSGEYAGRREVLEQLPFFSGYGVETGLLIDMLERYGLSAIGQVNLGQRIHRNQSLRALSTMSFAIMQVILERVEQRREISLLAGINRSMKLIKFADDQLSLELKAVHDTERPAIASITAYSKVREALRLVGVEG